MRERYSIAEWFGLPFARMPASQRQALAKAALGQQDPPQCPFQPGKPPCRKPGGVCSIRSGDESPVITCPRRFDYGDLLPRWLAKIVGYAEVYLASEVPFMRSPSTSRSAGRIDLVVAKDGEASSWFGLEVQAVYFSGIGPVPVARDSGRMRGKRAIGGGRALRCVLYQAALAASHHNADLKIFAKHLRDKGKPHRVVVMAVARKLITVVNALCKSRQSWAAQAA